MLLDIIKSILYGIVEGISEWLPISSTGHLILLEKFIPFANTSDNFFDMYEVVIQLGAILAVILLFFNKLWPFCKNSGLNGIQKHIKPNSIELWLKVLVATVPSAIIGLLFDDWLTENVFGDSVVTYVISATLIIYGILFIIMENNNSKKTPKFSSLNEVGYSTAAFIGCFQVLALIPGTSRSGATILGAIFLGLARPAAAEFSFFLAIPTMVGASFLKLVKFLLETSFTTNEIVVLLTGMIISFIVSVVAIKGLMAYVKKHSFALFGYYRIVLGIIVLALSLAHIM